MAPRMRAISAREVLARHCRAGLCLRRGDERLRGAGVGGLKTALPPVRDGFSPQQIDLGRYLFFDPVLSAAPEPYAFE